MEGPLSKWTNVMQGWQYRWFVLDENAGMLSYYTSKEKMNRGQRRGCVRLKGAVVGIDDEDDSTFTITVDQKMFHFQGRDAEERDRWIRALEVTIQRHSGYYRPKGKIWVSPVSPQTTLSAFERRIGEADKYLQLMIEQVKSLESRIEQCTNQRDKETLVQVVESASAMLDSVKHSIVVLQLAKNQVAPIDGLHVRNGPQISRPHPESISEVSESESVSVGVSEQENVRNGPPEGSADMSAISEALEASESMPGGLLPPEAEPLPPPAPLLPMVSYSSSEDEEDEYFDATEEYANLGGSNEDIDCLDIQEDVISEEVAEIADLSSPSSVRSGFDEPEPDFGDEKVDFDGVYENDDEDELGNVQEHGSVIMHLLSQVSIGMDLTKITLPTFILERRSLLEMYADFFAHPDLFVSVVDLKTPEERMIGILRWYLSCFHAGRKSGVAKKPYNPILGETFRCVFDVPGCSKSEIPVKEGPYPGSDSNQLTFFAEQVSHHPPVSAFYAEHPGKRIQVDAHIWTKSKFLGLSIGVHNIGQGCVSFLDHGEEYISTFPSGYGRSILTTPWIELGGKCKIVCEKTGYYATIEFLLKPFYGGKANCIQAEVYKPGNKQSILSVKGQWNGVMMKKLPAGDEVFLDVHALQLHKKKVQSVMEQRDFESRKLWRHVTAALKQNDIHKATKGKHWLEQRQRKEAKERAAAGAKWVTNHFQEVGEHWVYKWPLEKRLKASTENNKEKKLT